MILSRCYYLVSIFNLKIKNKGNLKSILFFIKSSQSHRKSLFAFNHEIGFKFHSEKSIFYQGKLKQEHTAMNMNPVIQYEILSEKGTIKVELQANSCG